MNDFYNEIIRQENVYFRGVTFGANISEIEKVEGSKFRKKTGSTPALHYYWETGDIEDIDLFFGLDKEDKVEEVQLTFITKPSFYHKQRTGEDLTAFEQLFYKNNIQEYSKISDDLVSRILIMLTNDMGTPVEEHKDEIFMKDYHNFKRWIWYKDYSGTQLRMSLTYYFDDSDGYNIKGTVSLLLSENITP